MSRIRSRLDSILATGGEAAPPVAAPARHPSRNRPRPAYPAEPPMHSPHAYAAPRADMHAYQPAPAPYPAAAGAHAQALESIQSNLEKLSARINAIPRTPPATPPASASAAPHPEARMRSAQDEVLRELRNGFDNVRSELRSVRETAAAQAGLDDDIRRISEGIAALQQRDSLHPDYVGQIHAELATLQSGLEHLLQKPDSHIDLSGVSRSIESGYSEIVNKLDAFLTQRPENQIELPDYSAQFDALTRRIEEVSRAVVSLSVSMPDQSSSLEFERLEARLGELTASVDAMLGQGPAGDRQIQAPGSEIIEQLGARLDLLSGKIDSLSSLDAAGGAVLAQTSAGESHDGAAYEALRGDLALIAERLDAISFAPGGQDAAAAADPALNQRLETIQNDVGIVARMLESLSAQDGFSLASDGEGLSGIEARLAELADRIDGMAAPGATIAVGEDGRAHNEMGDEALTILRDLVGRVDALSATAPQAGPSDERLQSLETQLAEIAGQLGTISTAPSDVSAIAERLDHIEGQIAASRDIVIDIATEAASRTASETGGADAGGLTLHAVLEELKALRAERAQEPAPAQAADGEIARIAGSIEQIAARLDMLEQPVMQAAPSHASAMHSPSMYPEPMGHGGDQPGMPYGHDDAGYADADYAGAAAMETPSALDQDFSADGSMEHPAARHHGYPDHGIGEAIPAGEFAPQADHLDHGHSDGEEYAAGAMHPGDLAHPHVQPGHAEAETVDADDVPLAPGSGMPDLEALVRRATNKKREDADAHEGAGKSGSNESLNELMAAARRAAQAAALEAETASQKESSRKPRKSRLPGGGSKFSLNRKTLLAAAGVAALLIGGTTIVPRFFKSATPVSQPAIEQANPSGAEQMNSQSAPGDATETMQQSAMQQSAMPGTDESLMAVEGDGETDAVRNTGGEDASASPQIAGDDRMAGNDGQMVAGQGDAQGIDQGSDAMTGGGQAALALNDAEPAETGSEVVPANTVGMDVPAGMANTALREAVAAGNPDAIFEIGRRYTDGEGGERDLTEAVRWYEMAAERGHAPAQYRLGNFYEKGHGVAQDQAMAARWYVMAAEAGNALAMHNLAVLNAMGVIDGDADMQTALGWFEKAAELGVKDSQVNLGILYTKGMGVEEDLVTAYRWFAIAARGGDADAAKKRDTVAQAMRPEQLEKARGEAEIWKPTPINQAANVAQLRDEWKSGSAATNVSAASIRKIQQLLTRAGYDAGPADGVMGARTRDAISRFQEAEGLAVTGTVTPELVKLLDSLSI